MRNNDELDGDKHSFCKYMYDPKIIENEGLDELYLKMTTETIELFESKDCSMVLDQCLDHALEFVVDSLAGHFLGSEGISLFMYSR